MGSGHATEHLICQRTTVSDVNLSKEFFFVFVFFKLFCFLCHIVLHQIAFLDSYYEEKLMQNVNTFQKTNLSFHFLFFLSQKAELALSTSPKIALEFYWTFLWFVLGNLNTFSLDYNI